MEILPLFNKSETPTPKHVCPYFVPHWAPCFLKEKVDAGNRTTDTPPYYCIAV